MLIANGRKTHEKDGIERKRDARRLARTPGTICGFVFYMDEHMYEDQEFRKLINDPEFQVALDFGGCFFRALIGDKESGFRAVRRTRTFEAAIKWLQTQAQELYPYSRYIQQLSAEVVSTHVVPGCLFGGGPAALADASEKHVLTHS